MQVVLWKPPERFIENVVKEAPSDKVTMTIKDPVFVVFAIKFTVLHYSC